jgi:hypothetical protein
MSFLHHPAFMRAMIIASVVIGLVHLATRIQIIPFHMRDIGGTESFTIHGIQLMLLGHPLYTDPEQLPFCMIPHSPIYFYLCTAMGKLAGVDPMEPQQVYMLSRIVSLLLNLLSTWLAVRCARALDVQKGPAWMIGILHFCTLFVTNWSRPDSLYMVFFAAFILFGIKAVRTPVLTHWLQRPWLLTGLMAALAIFSKQTGVLCFLIGVPAAFLTRGIRAAFSFALAGGVGALFLLGLTLTQTDLATLYKNIVLTNTNGVTFQIIKGMFTDKYGLCVLPWMLLGAVWAVVQIRRGDATGRFLGVGCLIALAFGMATSLKVGGGPNYLTEFYLYVFLLAGRAACSSSETSSPSPLRPVFAAYATFTVLFRSAMFFSAIEVSHWFKDDHEGYERERAVAQRMGSIAPTGPIFQRQIGFTELFLPERATVVQKWVVTASGDKFGLDMEELYRMLRAGEIGVAVSDDADTLRFNKRTFPIYRELYSNGHEHVFVPARQH